MKNFILLMAIAFGINAYGYPVFNYNANITIAPVDSNNVNAPDFSIYIPTVMKYDSYMEKVKDVKGNWGYRTELHFVNKSMHYTAADPFGGDESFDLYIDTIHTSKTITAQVEKISKFSETYIKPIQLTSTFGIMGYVIYDLEKAFTDDWGGGKEAEYRVYYLFPLKESNTFGEIYLRFNIDFMLSRIDINVDKEVNFNDPQTRELVNKSIDEVFQSVKLK